MCLLDQVFPEAFALHVSSSRWDYLPEFFQTQGIPAALICGIQAEVGAGTRASAHACRGIDACKSPVWFYFWEEYTSR